MADVEFVPVCDDVEHAGVTTADIVALVTPAWHLATLAVDKFPEVSLLGQPLIQLKTALERLKGALELQLAFVANRSQSAPVTSAAFKDVCHMAQTVFYITGVLEPAIPDLSAQRVKLATVSHELSLAFANRRGDSGFPFWKWAFWGLGTGAVTYWWWTRPARKRERDKFPGDTAYE